MVGPFNDLTLANKTIQTGFFGLFGKEEGHRDPIDVDDSLSGELRLQRSPARSKRRRDGKSKTLTPRSRLSYSLKSSFLQCLERLQTFKRREGEEGRGFAQWPVCLRSACAAGSKVL